MRVTKLLSGVNLEESNWAALLHARPQRCPVPALIINYCNAGATHQQLNYCLELQAIGGSSRLCYFVKQIDQHAGQKGLCCSLCLRAQALLELVLSVSRSYSVRLCAHEEVIFTSQGTHSTRIKRQAALYVIGLGQLCAISTGRCSKSHFWLGK